MWGGATQVSPCPSSPPSHHIHSVLLPAAPSPAGQQPRSLFSSKPLFVSVCCTALGLAGAQMDLSTVRAWLCACFHFHSMEELLELSC